jgi:hypothetical protein
MRRFSPHLSFGLIPTPALVVGAQDDITFGPEYGGFRTKSANEEIAKCTCALTICIAHMRTRFPSYTVISPPPMMYTPMRCMPVRCMTITCIPVRYTQ